MTRIANKNSPESLAACRRLGIESAWVARDLDLEEALPFANDGDLSAIRRALGREPTAEELTAWSEAFRTTMPRQAE